MFVHGQLAVAFDLEAQAKQHLALAQSGVRPLTNYYAALTKRAEVKRLLEANA
jgi:hypothetical protein